MEERPGSPLGAAMRQFCIMCEELHRENWAGARRQVGQNDPNLRNITVLYGEELVCNIKRCTRLNTLQEGNCREFGASIGQNMCLKKLPLVVRLRSWEETLWASFAVFT